MRLRRSRPTISVVVPAYDVEAYLPACLDSILASPWRELEVVVVDDGSGDGTGALADDYAARDPRVRVVHTTNRGLGAARNEGVRHATGSVLAFADSDDVVPPGAYPALMRQLGRGGGDLVVGSIARWSPGAGADRELQEPPWMRRLHRERRSVAIDQHPELLGDVFAWNKVYTRPFYEGADLRWTEGVRYEDQPTTTRAYLLARRIGVVSDVVYHWRVRADGTSITQQRGTLADLQDRWTTKRMTRDSVLAYGSPKVTAALDERVLPGDLHTYFVHIPGCDDAWWELLVAGVREFFGDRSLVHSTLPPVHRLVGWLVEQDRRDDAALVMRAVADLPPGQRLERVRDANGVRLEVPGLPWTSVARAALDVRPTEV